MAMSCAIAVATIPHHTATTTTDCNARPILIHLVFWRDIVDMLIEPIVLGHFKFGRIFRLLETHILLDGSASYLLVYQRNEETQNYRHKKNNSVDIDCRLFPGCFLFVIHHRCPFFCCGLALGFDLLWLYFGLL